MRQPGTPSGIDSHDLRDPPLGALFAKARRLAARSAPTDQPRPGRTLKALLDERNGRLGRDDPALAAVADAYAQLVAGGDRAPARTLAALHGGSAGTWTNRATAARRRGFLTPVVKGEAGGTVTPEALKLLEIDAPAAD